MTGASAYIGETMTGLPRAIIKKYGVSKKAWAVFRSGTMSYGGASEGIRWKKKTRKTGGYVAKKKGKYVKHRRGFFGMGAIKPIALGAVGGTAGGLVASYVPMVNTWPHNRAIVGAATGAGASALMGARGIKGLLVSGTVGALAGEFLAPPVGQAINTATGQNLYQGTY